MHLPTASRTRNQILLYIDIIVLGVAALALVASVHNAYYAGYWADRLPGAAASRTTWMTVNLVAFGLALTWFLARFFSARIRDLAHTA